MATEGGRFAAVHRLFLEACELDEAERDALLARECAGDDELRREVLALLEEERAGARRLERPAAEAVLGMELRGTELHGAELRGTGLRGSLPEAIAGFRIRGLLGAGGAGIVYEAEQSQPRRAVALKLIRSAFASEEERRRFEHEGQVLAWLHHPGIAAVYATGVADSGLGPQPYLAMELVRGERLDEFAHRRALSAGDRLELVARVCDAVHHAHQKGVIHRDLKPGNILVEESGQPKVLDFGVARITNADLDARTRRTGAGEILGTLPYMSPEQVLADPAQLDVRSDVYALGVIAYELLTGRRPHEVSSTAIPAAIQSIVHDRPTSLGAVDRKLRGDVETIVHKAMEKEKERRYGSAAELAADIRRYLGSEPIVARPASLAYQFRKFTRRQRGLTVGVGLALLAVLAGLTAFALQARATARAEIQAAAEARGAAAIDSFLIQDLLSAPDPRVRGRDVRVLDVLEGAAARAADAFADSPERLARVRATLGKSFLALDEFELAERNLRDSLAWLREHRGESAPLTLETESTLIELLIAREDRDEVLPLARSSFARQSAVLGSDHKTTLTTATNLSTALQRNGQLAEAETVLRDVLARRERTLGADDTATLLARENLSALLVRTGRVAEGVREREAALALRRARYGERDPGTVLARLFVAEQGLGMGTLQDPVATFEPLVADLRAVFGERSQFTGRGMTSLAVALERSGRPEDALAVYQDSIRLLTSVAGASHESTLQAKFHTVELLMRLGLHDQAVPLAEECLADWETGVRDPLSHGLAQLFAGEARLASGDRDRAAGHLKAAIETFESASAQAPVARTFLTRARAALARAAAGAGDQ